MIFPVHCAMIAFSFRLPFLFQLIMRLPSSSQKSLGNELSVSSKTTTRSRCASTSDLSPVFLNSRDIMTLNIDQFDSSVRYLQNPLRKQACYIFATLVLNDFVIRPGIVLQQKKWQNCCKSPRKPLN